LNERSKKEAAMTVSHRRILPFLLALILVGALTASCASKMPPDTLPSEAWVPSTARGSEAEAPFLAGVAQLNIVPNHPVAMGGYGAYLGPMKNARISQGVHDPLFATALYFEKGDERLVLIAYDLLGLFKTDVDEIRAMVELDTGISADRVIVTASHTHHGPDTVGLWGTVFPPRSGRDEDYMGFIKRQGVNAVREAIKTRQPATLEAAVGEESTLHVNHRSKTDPNAPIDHTLTALSLLDREGKVFATLTNWGCHPTTEGGDNVLFSSDWVHYLRTGLAKHYPDATHMFVNGAIGGAVQPAQSFADAETSPVVPPFTWADQMGTTLADKVAGMIAKAEPVAFDAIEVKSAKVRAYAHNGVYQLGQDLHLLNAKIPAKGELYYSTVTAVKMGSLRFGTMPGEIMPDLTNEIRTDLGGTAQVMVGLGQDWLGYIMAEKYYFDERYAYEKMLCIGPQFGPNIIKTYKALKFD
jgi:hypothetical protein